MLVVLRVRVDDGADGPPVIVLQRYDLTPGASPSDPCDDGEAATMYRPEEGLATVSAWLDEHLASR